MGSRRILSLVVTGDWHLRASVPDIRYPMGVDRWREYQLEIVRNLLIKVATKYEQVLVAGDLFHIPGIDTTRQFEILTNLLSIMEVAYGSKSPNLRAIPGQHDIPNHSWGQIQHSAFGVCSHAYPDSFFASPSKLKCFEPTLHQSMSLSRFLKKPKDKAKQDADIFRHRWDGSITFISDMGSPFKIEQITQDHPAGPQPYNLWSLPYGTNLKEVESVAARLDDICPEYHDIPNVAMVHVGVSPCHTATFLHGSGKYSPPSRLDAALVPSNLRSQEVLNRLSFADLIVSGDFHQAFIDRTILNVGPLTCQSRAQQGLNAWRVHFFEDSEVDGFPFQVAPIEKLSSMEEALTWEQMYSIPNPANYLKKEEKSDDLSDEVRDALAKFMESARGSIESMVLDMVKGDKVLKAVIEKAIEHAKK